jgi:8-oxo-dGTP pyrophosphatase MutT (NUDIX family)
LRREATWWAGVITTNGSLLGNGNGWAWCSYGHRHWGRYGAAGLLITDGARVLLQHRAAWTHEGGTWAVPGGARDSHESPINAALREAAEETSLDPAAIAPFDQWVDDHGGWSYVTIIARTASDLEVVPINPESAAIRWWPIAEVDRLPLHRGFAAAWPQLRTLIDA